MTESKIIVAGTAMTPFHTPAKSPDYVALAGAAVDAALKDAGLDYQDLNQAYVGYVYGDSTAGQATLYPMGLTGLPVFNVNNNCATGSSALYMARQAVLSGMADCVLALGFEQMRRGALQSQWDDRTDPLKQFLSVVDARFGYSDAPMALRLFGGAALDYQQTYGTPDEVFAMIACKARRHAAHNPFAVFREPLSVEEVMASPKLYGPLTRLQCCPPTCGAAAAIVCSADFARRKGVADSMSIVAQIVVTDMPDSFTGDDLGKTVGTGMTRRAAGQLYEKSGVGPDDIDVIELHDCFTSNELLTYEGLGLVSPGGAERFIRDGDNSYGGKVVINPSGGLLAKGHPLGATGLAQCHELVSQLRGAAGARQVDGARLALAHNIGLGGACVISLYESASGRV